MEIYWNGHVSMLMHIHPRQGPIFQIITVIPTMVLKAKMASREVQHDQKGRENRRQHSTEMAVLL